MIRLKAVFPYPKDEMSRIFQQWEFLEQESTKLLEEEHAQAQAGIPAQQTVSQEEPVHHIGSSSQHQGEPVHHFVPSSQPQGDDSIPPWALAMEQHLEQSMRREVRTIGGTIMHRMDVYHHDLLRRSKHAGWY